jgi:hypothetical protein
MGVFINAQADFIKSYYEKDLVGYTIIDKPPA